MQTARKRHPASETSRIHRRNPGALASGLTNAVTYTIDDLGTDITLPENTQKTEDPPNRAWRPNFRSRSNGDAIKTHHMKQVKTLVTRLKSIPEGKGTMFDNTTIIYMPETGAGHHGPDTEAPMVLMTGRNSNSTLRVATSACLFTVPKDTRP